MPIWITLIVEGPPNLDCFPNDDGRDTVTKFFIREIYNFVDTIRFAGYRDSNLNDSTLITFWYDSGIAASWRVSGFFEGCTTGSVSSNSGGTRRSWRFHDVSSGCNSVSGTVVRDPDKTGDFDKVHIIYSIVTDYSTSPYKRESHVFDGRFVR